VDPKWMEDVKYIMDVYFTAYAFSSNYASTLMVGVFCCSTVNLGSWGRYLFILKIISSYISDVVLHKNTVKFPELFIYLVKKVKIKKNRGGLQKQDRWR
jgi:hypothetical protein